MAELSLALPTVFLHEGLYSDNQKDPGGATNYGISLRFLKQTGDLDGDGFLDGDVNRDGDIDIDDIKKLSKEEASKLYDLYFWQKYRYWRIADQLIATKVFDLSVNMGAVAAHICAQRAIRASLTGFQLVEDGLLGQRSVAAVNMANPVKLLPALKSEAAGYYRAIRLKNGNEKEFINGWLKRAYSDAVK